MLTTNHDFYSSIWFGGSFWKQKMQTNQGKYCSKYGAGEVK